MNELITFKGSNDGLILVITKKANFNQIKEALSKKLASCSNFFEANTTILLKDDKFSQEEQNILSDILKQYQLNLKIVAVDKTATNQHCSAQNPPLIIKRTVRGGEEIFSKGSIVIEGNVNPGAKMGWKLVIITLFVITGTFIFSALVADVILKLTGAI